MEARRSPAFLLVLLGLLAVSLVWLAVGPRPRPEPRGPIDGALYRVTEAAADEVGASVVPRTGPLRFAPGTTGADQQHVLDALGAARPEARRLVDLVAGITTVAVGKPPEGAVGEARGTDDGGFLVTLDLPTAGLQGLRGVRRVVLHELGHVLDHALVPTALESALDAAVPAGWGCDDGGRSGACASREERFAESFAKWALGDLGEGLYLGYRVPPPPPSWGTPLATLR